MRKQFGLFFTSAKGSSEHAQERDLSAKVIKEFLRLLARLDQGLATHDLIQLGHLYPLELKGFLFQQVVLVLCLLVVLDHLFLVVVQDHLCLMVEPDHLYLMVVLDHLFQQQQLLEVDLNLGLELLVDLASLDLLQQPKGDLLLVDHLPMEVLTVLPFLKVEVDLVPLEVLQPISILFMAQNLQHK